MKEDDEPKKLKSERWKIIRRSVREFLAKNQPIENTVRFKYETDPEYLSEKLKGYYVAANDPELVYRILRIPPKLLPAFELFYNTSNGCFEKLELSTDENKELSYLLSLPKNKSNEKSHQVTFLKDKPKVTATTNVMSKGEISQAFVWTLDKRLLFSKHPGLEDPIENNFKHTSFVYGLRVALAGMITLDEHGKILRITNNSGHYKPNQIEMYNAISEMIEKYPNGFSDDCKFVILNDSFSIDKFKKIMEEIKKTPEPHPKDLVLQKLEKTFIIDQSLLIDQSNINIDSTIEEFKEALSSPILKIKMTNPTKNSIYDFIELLSNGSENSKKFVNAILDSNNEKMKLAILFLAKFDDEPKLLKFVSESLDGNDNNLKLDLFYNDAHTINDNISDKIIEFINKSLTGDNDDLKLSLLILIKNHENELDQKFLSSVDDKLNKIIENIINGINDDLKLQLFKNIVCNNISIDNDLFNKLTHSINKTFLDSGNYYLKIYIITKLIDYDQELYQQFEENFKTLVNNILDGENDNLKCILFELATSNETSNFTMVLSKFNNRFQILIQDIFKNDKESYNRIHEQFKKLLFHERYKDLRYYIGGNLNLLNSVVEKETLLHFVIKKNDYQALKTLLEMGADPKIKPDQNHKTALELSRELLINYFDENPALNHINKDLEQSVLKSIILSDNISDGPNKLECALKDFIDSRRMNFSNTPSQELENIVNMEQDDGETLLTSVCKKIINPKDKKIY